jgi:MinD superfamily P-loop ATPase
MGHIKEPIGVDFIVDPTPLTTEDRKRISEIIAHYKATGKKLVVRKSKTESRVQKKSLVVKIGRQNLAN